MVLSLVCGFTTKALSTDWISEDLQYVVYDESNGCMILSAAPVYYATINTSWTALKTDNDAITTPYNGTGKYFYVPAQQVDAGLYFPEAYYLDPVYSEEGQIAQYHVYTASHYIGQNGTYAVIIANTDQTPIGKSGTLCANHNITGWTGTINDLPEDIGFDKESLSSVGQQAIIIKQTIDSAVTDYEQGNITITELKTTIIQQSAQLDTLSPSGIADLIAVNNAQNSIQIAQEQVTQATLNISDSLADKIEDARNDIYFAWYQYFNEFPAKVDSDIAIDSINSALAPLMQMVGNGTVKSQADLEAINSIINYGQSCISSIQNNKDIDATVAESAQEGEEREKEYLNDLTAETTTTIEQLSPSRNLTGEQISVTTEILQGVWENPIVKKIIPLAACFLVICVALGIKYRL